MDSVTAEAVILQAFPYSDTSKILRLLTRTHGVRSVIARGALRPRSRYGGVLEPFTEGIATLQLKEGREVQTLVGFELTRAHRRLSTDLLRLGGASLLAEIVMRTGSEEPHPELHKHLGGALGRLEGAPAASLEPRILAEAWALIALLGFAPELKACTACGTMLEPESPTAFDNAAGGVRCPSCAEGAPGAKLPPHARRDLMRLVAGEAVTLPETAGHWTLLSRFLDYHVLAGGTLRSLSFVADILAGELPCGA